MGSKSSAQRRRKHRGSSLEEAEEDLPLYPSANEQTSESLEGVKRVRGVLSRLSDEHLKYIKIAVVVLLLAVLSFGLGRLSVANTKESSIEIEQFETGASVFDATGRIISDGREENRTSKESSSVSGAKSDEIYVGSVNSDKYHYPWCPGAKRINESNKISFGTKEEAERAGYEPAANCEGL